MHLFLSPIINSFATTTSGLLYLYHPPEGPLRLSTTPPCFNSTRIQNLVLHSSPTSNWWDIRTTRTLIITGGWHGASHRWGGGRKGGGHHRPHAVSSRRRRHRCPLANTYTGFTLSLSVRSCPSLNATSSSSATTPAATVALRICVLLQWWLWKQCLKSRGNKYYIRR